MSDITSLLSKIDTNGLVGKMLGGMATKNFGAGLLAGGLATSLLGKSEIVEDTAKIGGLALLGTLAYKAYNNYQQGKQSGQAIGAVDAVKSAGQGMFAQASSLLAGLTAPQQQQAAVAAPQQASPQLALSIVRSMIAAAKADGGMDDQETQKIMGHIEAAGLSAQENMAMMRELASTADVATIATGAQTPEEAAQIYLAAVLVCDSQCANEQAFLASLATALKLDPAFTQSLQQQLLSLNTAQAA